MVLIREIIFFQHPSTGREPVTDWIAALDLTTRLRVLALLERGRQGHLGHTKSLGRGLFEIKIHFGPGYRIYYALYGLKVILLLTAGDKSSQYRDIETAREYLTLFKRSLKDG